MAQVRGRKRVRLIAPYELATSSTTATATRRSTSLFRNVTITDVEISITMTFTNFVFDNDFYSFYGTYQDI